MKQGRELARRQIGETDLEVSTLGVGTASLAGLFGKVSLADARCAIESALSKGVTYVDTAPYYGLGKAERLAGDAVRANRKDIVLSSKAGRLLTPYFGDPKDILGWIEPLPFIETYDYSYDGIMRSHEASLHRLGLNHIDILFAHDIGTMTHGDENARHWQDLVDGGYRAMCELRESGQVSAIGLGVNEWQILMDALDLGDWDVFLLAGRYTLLEQESLSPFLERCLERNASVVCGGPFNSGILAGGDTWNYYKAPEEVIERVRGIALECEAHGVPLSAAALQFPIKHPAICSVLPGPRTAKEFDQIWDWWHLDIPNDLWVALRAKGLIAEVAPI